MGRCREGTLWVMIFALIFLFSACEKKLEKGGIAEMPKQDNLLSSADLELSLGKAAPECGATSTDGNDTKLSDLKGSWVVLYFYPKAFTGG